VTAGAESIDEIIGLYTMANAYAEAGSGLGTILLDIANASNKVESNTGKDGAMRTAINNYVADMDALVNGDPLVFYKAMGEQLVNLSSTGANSMLNICTNYGMLHYVVAGIRMGLSMGTFFGDQVTNMDAIAYYGTMMDMAGYFAKCTYDVVMDYQDDFRADNSYENAVKLNAVSELYLRVQALACQYAYSYSMAMAEKSVHESKYNEHLTAAAEVARYQGEINTLLTRGDVITIDDNGGISGFIASCPVTVVVENMDGSVAATLSTGKETVTPGYDDYYTVFGDDMDSKAGLYETDSQRIRIEGTGSGTMDLQLFDTAGGKLVNSYIYTDVPVSKGDEFTVGDGVLIVNGTTEIKPSESMETGHPFTDVSGHWAESYIGEAYNKGYFSGMTPTTFVPGGQVTRGQFVTVLARYAGVDLSKYTEQVFSDVPAAKYYAPAVQWASENGIVNGTGATTFSPDAKITRQDIATIFLRYIKFAGLELDAKAEVKDFKDKSSIAGYAAEAVEALCRAGVLTGRTDGSFDPRTGATRAEAATIFCRFAAAVK